MDRWIILVILGKD